MKPTAKEIRRNPRARALVEATVRANGQRTAARMLQISASTIGYWRAEGLIDVPSRKQRYKIRSGPPDVWQSPARIRQAVQPLHPSARAWPPAFELDEEYARTIHQRRNSAWPPE